MGASSGKGNGHLLYQLFICVDSLMVGNLLTSSLLQINAINAATEAACLILSVDETVKNPKVNLLLVF